ncbi:MAG: M20/M25/M40 family metallo-hydrolase [Lachnospiraceae bacterium]|uniref:M20 family metallopeptidase n=1 Tax=Candidatus Weimeria bifida TaxID=2599074 RepID=A0A6N7IZU5_9FIRM|nr:M20 family metallopeptidase [Candidatus Weimeria bifida]RRF96548.1 MAG: M20/M25/M40 family metallo-hydrolase [Lachnospiraceae bacterium]
MNEVIKKFTEDHIDELKKDISELCSIPSVLSDAREGAPFGEDCRKALLAAGSICEKYGFKTTNYDNYCIAADFDESLPKHLDMLGHTDVVPAGEGWTVTDPFTVIEKDGRLYGRGTSDDKGPVLCALYAMRAIKESGIPLKRNVRLILGSDEETGSIDITKYYAKEPEADYTFSPDAEFPLINIEKGQFRGTFKADAPVSDTGVQLISLNAGVALNAVPNRCRMEFIGTDRQMLEDACDKLKKEIPVDAEISDDTHLTIIGESAHASTPEIGVNAGLAGITLLKFLPLSNDRRNTLLSKVLTLFPYGAYDGSGLGISMTDKENLSLSATLDLFSVDRDGMSFSFDSRTPLNASDENCLAVAGKKCEDAGFTFETPGIVPPHYVPSDSAFVKDLLSAYNDVTGQDGKAMGIGGGTYVHDIKNGVAFGAVLPGIDTHMHGADEFIDIDNLTTAVEVFAEAILKICG